MTSTMSPWRRCSVRGVCDREPDLKVIGEYGDPRTPWEAIRAHSPQLLFLDIPDDSMSVWRWRAR